MEKSVPRPKIEVLVADNNPLHTQLIAAEVGRDRHIDVIGSVVSAAGVIKSVRDHRPDVLLISGNLEEQPNGGLCVLQELQANRCDLKSVVLLESSTRTSVVQAFLSGARGVLYRTASPKTLRKCIRMVHEGQIWANNEEIGFLLAALAAAIPSPCPHQLNGLRLLSERERDVVRCLAGAGLSNKEIAQHLGISDHTVKNYMLRIFDKLGVSSRVELVFYVLSRINLIYGDEANSGTAVERRPTPEPAMPLKELSKYPARSGREVAKNQLTVPRMGYTNSELTGGVATARPLESPLPPAGSESL
jgi:two-component system, NarL family, nitrate/nitrite response regulator NarL